MTGTKRARKAVSIARPVRISPASQCTSRIITDQDDYKGEGDEEGTCQWRH